MAYTYSYPRPAVTADCVVFSSGPEGLEVLLVERSREPFRGHWAFPGGFMEMEETAEACAVRELEEETGVRVSLVRQIGAFSAVGRDPRGRTVTIAFYTWTDRCSVSPEAGDDAARVGWFRIGELPPLAFDHEEILSAALARLQEDMEKGLWPGE